MTAKVIFAKCEKNYAGLMKSLKEIEEAADGEPLEKIEQSLMKTDVAISVIKEWAQETDFNSAASEVRFFKEIKPMFVSQFIYYAKILEIEAAKPNAGQHILKDYYEHELQQLKNFIDKYPDFYEYYRRKATYMDEKYFVRNEYDLKMGIDHRHYNYDRKFATSHDHLVAQIIANDRLEHYLLDSIYHLEGYFFEKFSEKSPLTWSSSKSALVELIYGLHGMHCFNGGNVDVSEVARFIEKSFNIDLGNYYKTFNEIKNRKMGRTKFLHALNESLNQHLENLDGH